MADPEVVSPEPALVPEVPDAPPADFPALLRLAEAHLRASSPEFAGLIDHVGPCTLTPDPDVFAVLVRAVIAQLISTAAAKSITLRLQAKLKNKVTPRKLKKLTVEELKACGVSGAKQRTLHGLADHFIADRKFVAELAAADDATTRAKLLPLFGVGPWTVDMLMIFGLGRADVLPVGDLGLRAGVRDLLRLPDLPDAKELVQIAEPWRPYRAVATWFLWRGRGWVPQSGADGD